jgi:choline dehydrogenase-like flavoprotein
MGRRLSTLSRLLGRRLLANPLIRVSAPATLRRILRGPRRRWLFYHRFVLAS